MKTKLLSLFLVAIAAINLSASNTQVNGIWYDFDSSTKTASVTYQGDSYSSFRDEYTGSVVIPKTVTYGKTTYSVKTIGNYAFCACTNLTSITIPNSVTTIGESAFSSCRGLTSITIPNSVTSIGNSAFSYCSSLPVIDNLRYADTYLVEAIDKTLSTYTIKDGTRWIGWKAFYACTNLTSITIPNSVTSIEDYAFKGCSGLTSITLPDSITTIGNYAFEDCSSLASITIPNSVTTIGYHAFASCTSLPVIGNLRYADTYLVEAVDKTLSTYTIKDGTRWIGREAFYACTNLTSITIPNSVTTIENRAFHCCYVLASASIGNSVTTIGEMAFSGCYILNTITIPNSVTTIGDMAFHSCGLTSIISYAQNPPTCGESCFYDVNKSISVYVPARSISLYKQAEEWKSFTNIEGNPNDYAIISCNIENGTISGAGKYIKGDTCTLTVTQNYGYHFTQWNDGNKDNPRTIIVTTDSTFTAQIEISQFKLTVNSSDGTMGYVSGSGTFNFQTQHRISATANYGYHFTQWNDGNTENPRKLILTKDTTFIAQFAPNNYQISVQSADSEMGDVQGSGSYVYKFKQIISATANYGYHFTQWSDGNTDNPRTIQVLNDTTFTAEFAKNIYTISTQAEHGSVAGGGDYEYLSTVQLTATADEHYHFVQWSDWNTNNPRQITVEGNKTYTAIFSIDQHTISAYAENGTVRGTGNYDYGTNAMLTVIPDFGYEFAAWSDGNTDNPRTVLVTKNASYYSTCVLTTNGFCGNNLYWEYKDGSLIINGQGTMYNYSSQEVPWLMYRTDIKKVELSDGITSIGNNAFYGCSALISITIPNSVTMIGEYAFYGCPLSSLIVPHSVQYINKGAFQECSRLVSLSLGSGLWEIGDYAFSGDYRIEEITSYAEITPTTYTNTFNGITKKNVYLYVPENCIRRYQIDPNWNEFDIRTKAADKKPIDGDNPIVTPSDQDVTITWAITDGADTYTLTITKNGETVCVLTFNAQGQLTNIAFAAPGHNDAHQAPAATLTAQGYQFTVTGLNPGTAYNYSVTATDAGGQTLAEHKGNFSTTGGGTPTSVDEVHDAQCTMHKVLRNGQILLVRNNATYTLMGQKVR